jgi:hypothetical protein
VNFFLVQRPNSAAGTASEALRNTPWKESIGKLDGEQLLASASDGGAGQRRQSRGLVKRRETPLKTHRWADHRLPPRQQVNALRAWCALGTIAQHNGMSRHTWAGFDFNSDDLT